MENNYGKIYSRLYHGHWWWRAREHILLQVIHSIAVGFSSRIRILDVGCGDGLFLQKLSAFGAVRGIETDSSLISDSNPFRQRINTKPLGDPEYLGWLFDLITVLDVIEHIEDDAKAICDIMAMLKPGGVLVITVPAFMVLWDHHDEINSHCRRYTLRSMRRLLSSHGEFLELRYLFNVLFIPKLLVKLINTKRRYKIVQHRIPIHSINTLMINWFTSEYNLLRSLRLPFGTSILAVLRKRMA